jgi:hypothetical protein
VVGPFPCFVTAQGPGSCHGEGVRWIQQARSQIACFGVEHGARYGTTTTEPTQRIGPTGAAPRKPGLPSFPSLLQLMQLLQLLQLLVFILCIPWIPTLTNKTNNSRNCAPPVWNRAGHGTCPSGPDCAMWGCGPCPVSFPFSILTKRLTILLFPDSHPRKTQAFKSTWEKGAIES